MMENFGKQLVTFWVQCPLIWMSFLGMTALFQTIALMIGYSTTHAAVVAGIKIAVSIGLLAYLTVKRKDMIEKHAVDDGGESENSS